MPPDLEQAADEIVDRVEGKLQPLEERVAATEEKLEDLPADLEDHYQRFEEQWGDVDDVPAFQQELKAAREELDELKTQLNQPGSPSGGASEKLEKANEAIEGFMRKGIDGIPDEQRDLVTDEGEQGGFLVPDPVVNEIVELMVDISPIRANARVETIDESDALKWPVQETQTSGSWSGERDTAGETDTPKFGMREIPVHEYEVEPRVSKQMIADSGVNIVNFLQSAIAKDVSQEFNKQYLLGNGDNKPLGFMNDDQNDVNVRTSGTAGEIDADDLLDLIYDIRTVFASNAQLYGHRKAIRDARKLKDSNGQYLWQPALQEGEPDVFAGVPIVETPDMDSDTTVAGNQPWTMANLQEGYVVADKATVDMLRDPYTSKPFVKFFTTWRTGGDVIRPEAIKILEVS